MRRKLTNPNLLTAIAEELVVKHDLRDFVDVNVQAPCRAKQIAMEKAMELGNRPQVLGRLIAAGTQQTDWANKWPIPARSPMEVLQQLAALAIFDRISELCRMRPIFTHSCPRCIYLGAMPRVSSATIDTTPDVFPHVVDLYACRGHNGFTVVARYGNHARQQFDSESEPLKEPHLTEGLQRAHRQGLLATT